MLFVFCFFSSVDRLVHVYLLGINLFLKLYIYMDLLVLRIGTPKYGARLQPNSANELSDTITVHHTYT